MTAGIRSRMVAVFGITAVALCGLDGPTGARPRLDQHQQGDHEGQENQRAKKKQKQDESPRREQKTQEQAQRQR